MERMTARPWTAHTHRKHWLRRFNDWLESRWVTPSYAGLMLGGISVFFFGAATNTMAGWLYVMSGIGFALLTIAAIVPARTLRSLRVSRRPIDPVTVGDSLTITLQVENPTPQAQTLIQLQDQLPESLGHPLYKSVELIPAGQDFIWSYTQPTQRRGVYVWQTVHLRTGTPFGLFWCRRSRTVKAKAVVYPTVLTLGRCSLIDTLGRDTSQRLLSEQRHHNATEGITRSLRPYRWGDPTRLVHWRSSARHGELRVRELELHTSGEEIVIGLDSAAVWPPANPLLESIPPPAEALPFEQAVIVAATLYFYACRQGMQVKLWTAATGSVSGNRVVLETLAAVQSGEGSQAEPLPDQPLVWLTADSSSLESLTQGSRWVLWPTAPMVQGSTPFTQSRSGLVIYPDQPLGNQLQN